MTHALVCWRCGASLAALTLPLRRLEVCGKCNAELHVCRLCVEYDTSKAKHCREPIAEEVRDKEHANFCDFYKPRPDAYRPANQAELDKTRAGLDALFGTKPGAPAGGAVDLPSSASPGASTSADEAKRRLEELFGKK
jgi:hypothetical protein